MKFNTKYLRVTCSIVDALHNYSKNGEYNTLNKFTIVAVIVDIKIAQR